MGEAALPPCQPFPAMARLPLGRDTELPHIHRRTPPPLVEKYGFLEEEIDFFRLHIVADAEHGERGFEILEQHATSDEIKASCVRLVREATQMRRLYLDGLYHKFLATPQAQAAE